jgi:Cdc6-like AAA superfamily ATPase
LILHNLTFSYTLYIGLCYGPPGVGKTLSARHYADWDRVASADPYAGRAAFRSDEVPGNGCVLYTATVVNSPRQIEDRSIPKE